jgi:HlyD family secretion protein/hemolysin D
MTAMSTIRLAAPAATAVHSRPVERDFLPAALAIVETPPSPLGRIFSACICAIFITAVTWAWLGFVDIVAVGSGKTVARSRTQVIQPLEPASIVAIHVHDGDQVKAGDVLIELDPTVARAEAARAAQELLQARLDQARLNVLLGHALPSTLVSIADASAEDIQRTIAQFEAQRAEQEEKLRGVEKEIAEKTADYAAATKLLDRARDSLPIIEEKAEIRRKVSEMQYGSRLAYLEAQQQVIDARVDLAVQTDRVAAAAATLDGLEKKKSEIVAASNAALLTDTSRAMAQENMAREALAKAKHRKAMLSLRAPIAGSVQQLTVHTVGGVVTPAQELMAIVPNDDAMEIEVVLPNREIGFIAPGQDVEIKVDAFPFTRYGLLRGKLISVSRDAEAAAPHSAPIGSMRPADQAGAMETADHLIYTARIAIVGAPLQVNGQAVQLLPGMTVKAEVKTGERRILDYLLSPLEEYAHDSLRER